MEEFLVEDLAAVFASHGEEDVAADEFVDDLALCWNALKNDIFSISELDHHVPGLPVHIPCLEVFNKIINMIKFNSI